MIKNSILELNRIIHLAAQATSTQEQVELIVDAISDVIATDVCSLYRQTGDKEMALIASHGLSKGHALIIPRNRVIVLTLYIRKNCPTTTISRAPTKNNSTAFVVYRWFIVVM